LPVEICRRSPISSETQNPAPWRGKAWGALPGIAWGSRTYSLTTGIIVSAINYCHSARRCACSFGLWFCLMKSFEKASRTSSNDLDEFIRRENIALFRKKLAEPGLSDQQRKTIEALLRKEQDREI